MSENDDRGRPGGAGDDGPHDPWKPPAYGSPQQPPAADQPPQPYGGYEPPPPYEPPAYGTPDAGQQPYAAPYGSAGQGPQGDQPPYGQPYGGSPYAGSRSPEAAKTRTSSITSVILNAVSIFICCNLFGIAGAIMSGLAISKVDTDLPRAKSLTRWSWVVFGVGLVLTVLAWAGIAAVIILSGDVSSDFQTDV